MRVRPTLSWLWLLVALQVAIPSSYYLLRDDRDDERFAWRMFSAVRVERCSARAFALHEGGGVHKVELATALHASWLRSLERGRKLVVRHFLEVRCSGPEVASVVLERDCSDASRRELPRVRYQYDCRSESFEVLR